MERDSVDDADGPPPSIEFRVSPKMKRDVGRLADRLNAEREERVTPSVVMRIFTAYSLANLDDALDYGDNNEISLYERPDDEREPGEIEAE